MYVLTWVCATFYASVGLVITLQGSSAQYHGGSRSVDLEMKYNLTNARKGKQAVKEAISFLIGQEKVALSANKKESQHYTTVAKNWNSRKKCVSKEDCPLCIVSMTAIITEGQFEYRGDDAKPPYPDKCWSQSVRYHVAPECEKEEASRGVVPVYKWRWTLKSAEEGYCRMPDPSPPSAAATHLERTDKNSAFSRIGRYSSNSSSNAEIGGAGAKKTLNVLFLGLSFMGQPWQSLGCLYSDLVVDGKMSSDTKELDVSVLDVKKNGGVCSGYDQKKIPYYHPIGLHSNYSTPVQHAESCSADHAYVVYKSADPSSPDVKVCFIYTFNVQKNVKPGHKLPCNFDWKDIDILLTIPPQDEIKLWVTNTGGKMKDLNHVKIIGVNQIYEGLMSQKLEIAYKKHGFNPISRDDYSAKFKQCGATGADVHYRLPGMTDYAVQAWFSLISTGLGTLDDERRKHTVGKLDFWS